ncbi:GFA family protein [Acinetobacter schindleri]|uniref:GFA family protein n=1 Tax=Acinetobacter schindleri TaxID=108981 RepID=UPI00097274F0|nr:GFA family protein [Acinetobacter schindleri]APX61768.1 GFA family glutathione-dependent formaldehyde-activating protein [Acinetobacter schindleri]
MSTQDHYAGSCLCGGIQYEVRGPLGDIIQCHCRRCRKATGTAFAINSPIAKADFYLLQGQHLLKSFTTTTGVSRNFCSECGSPIYSVKADLPDVYRLRIGSLDTTIEQKPTCHFYVSSKAEWEDIHDTLAQYHERP